MDATSSVTLFGIAQFDTSGCLSRGAELSLVSVHFRLRLIGLQVLEYLHPIDLLHLYHAVDRFKPLLREGDVLWRHAFRNFGDLVPVPDGIEGFGFAHLLFGVSKCEVCGSSPAHTNLTHQCHLCESCTFER